jgi:hypothetical protein
MNARFLPAGDRVEANPEQLWLPGYEYPRRRGKTRR